MKDIQFCVKACTVIRTLHEDMQTFLSVRKIAHSQQELEQKLSCLLCFLQMQETCQEINFPSLYSVEISYDDFP